jgi:hypothetical protein
VYEGKEMTGETVGGRLLVSPYTLGVRFSVRVNTADPKISIFDVT